MVLTIILVILQIILCFAAGYAWESIIAIRKKFETLNIRLSEIIDNNKEIVDINKQVLAHTEDVLNFSKATQKENKILIEHIANKKPNS